MMLFLHWICANYLAKKRKKGKKRTIYTHWREFKMLYRRVNGEYVDANDRHKVVKVWQLTSNTFLCRTLIHR
jgi:hypothetical protein